MKDAQRLRFASKMGAGALKGEFERKKGEERRRQATATPPLFKALLLPRLRRSTTFSSAMHCAIITVTVPGGSSDGSK